MMTETHTTTTTVTTGPSIEYQPDYVRSTAGILKIVEMVICLVIVICVAVTSYSGGGWVWFTALSAFITILILFIFHIIGLLGRLPGPWLLIEFIYYIIITVFFLIACIVTLVTVVRWGAHRGSVIATLIFCILATVVFAIDTFFQFKFWRNSSSTTVTSA